MSSASSFGPTTRPEDVPRELLPQFVEMVREDKDREKQHYGAMMIQKMVAVEHDPPLGLIIESGVCPKLVELLSLDANPKTQFEACWALTNIASGCPQETEYVLSLNASRCFIKLCYSSDQDCMEQATWAIGNLAGEGASVRDRVIGEGAIEGLSHLLQNDSSIRLSTTRNAVWALSNCCRWKPPPAFATVAPALPLFASLLAAHTDAEVAADAAWGLSYLTDGGEEAVAEVLKNDDLLRTLSRLLNAASPRHVTPGIRCVGNIVAHGSDSDVHYLLRFVDVQLFRKLLAHPKRMIRKEACWTLSNIVAGGSTFVSPFVDNLDVLREVLSCLDAPEFEVKKEAVWVIANLFAFISSADTS